MANLQQIQSGQGDLSSVVADLDSLDATAPPEIEQDFHLFDRIEHGLFDPHSSAALPQAQMDRPATATALEHVSTYLQQECDIS